MIFTRIVFFIAFSIFSLIPKTVSSLTEKQIAQEVLDDLFNSNGNFQYLKPAIEISESKKSVAYFKPRSNVIVIENTVFELCRQMGPDSLDALAYIIGHELAHSFQNDIKKHGHQTNFLSFSKHLHSSERLERSADIHGVFGAFLAGYRVKRIIPTILKLVYEEYDLMGKSLPNYPSYEVRIKTAKEVILKVEQLVNLYEAANFMTVLNEYEYASSAYEFIEQYYEGSEIYQNIGVNFVLHAINFTEENIDPYLLPLEISWESRLKKAFNNQGTKDLSPDELRYREKYLLKAHNNFEKAIKLDYNCHPCFVNLVITKTLLGDYQGAIDYYQKQDLERRATILGLGTEEKERAELALGIAFANSPFSKFKGNEIFEKLEKSSNPSIAYMASYNLSLSATIDSFSEVSISDYTVCPIPFEVRSLDGVRLHRCAHLTDFKLNDNHSSYIEKKANSTLFNFSGGNHTFIFQSVKNREGKIDLNNYRENLLHFVSTENGYLLACEQENVILRLDKSGNILEWAKYLRQ